MVPFGLVLRCIVLLPGDVTQVELALFMTDVSGVPSYSVRCMTSHSSIGVGEQQHLQAMLVEHFEMWTVARGAVAVGGDVVDALLPVLHPADIVVEGDGLRIAGIVGGCEPQQLRDLLPVSVVLDHAFLQHSAEVLPERGVLVRLVPGDSTQQVEHSLHRSGADRLDLTVLLQDLPGDVEREVR